jgi:hypothetical protein
MKPIAETMTRVAFDLPVARTVPTPPPLPLPVLPDDLRRQIDLMRPTLFTDRAGNAMTMEIAPTFHPGAACCAEQLRRALGPAPEILIRAWFNMLVKRTGPGPLSPDAVFEGLLDSCGDLPAPVWSGAALAEIVEAHGFLPFVKEIAPVLRAIANRLRADLRALDAIAGADPASRFNTVPARESTVPYALSPPPDRPLRAVILPDAAEITAPVRTVEAQIAACGRSDVDLLAARRKTFGQD